MLTLRHDLTTLGGFERSRAIRAEVLVRGVAGQVADLLGLTDQPAPAPSMQAERERARAVGYRLLSGAGPPRPARS